MNDKIKKCPTCGKDLIITKTRFFTMTCTNCKAQAVTISDLKSEVYLWRGKENVRTKRRA